MKDHRIKHAESPQEVPGALRVATIQRHRQRRSTSPSLAISGSAPVMAPVGRASCRRGAFAFSAVGRLESRPHDPWHTGRLESLPHHPWHTGRLESLPHHPWHTGRLEAGPTILTWRPATRWAISGNRASSRGPIRDDQSRLVPRGAFRPGTAQRPAGSSAKKPQVPRTRPSWMPFPRTPSQAKGKCSTLREHWKIRTGWLGVLAPLSEGPAQ